MDINSNFFDTIHNRLMVSCQASEGDAFRDSGAIARFAVAAVDGGAGGIRANGPEDIQAIREAVTVPILGLQKCIAPDGRILITPTVEAAKKLVIAGADAIALDCTRRGQEMGALDRLRAIRRDLDVPVVADIATVEEAVAAEAAGADAVASTMRGYTTETEEFQEFQPEFIQAVVKAVKVPVLAEGHINVPAEARDALRAGAHAVIIGSAITRPHLITEGFVKAMRPRPAHVAAIDMGGTNTKYGVVSADRTLLFAGSSPTPFTLGRDVLLDHLKRIASHLISEAEKNSIQPSRIGIATAGWVNPQSGNVVYATENLSGWTGTKIAEEVSKFCGLPVSVENDANALAVGEYVFGAARGVRDFICVTLGTGVGGGCYSGGKLHHGAHFFANALGHMPVVPDGENCTCGLKGCLEAYANAAALLRYANGRFDSAKPLIEAANTGDPVAARAVRELARYLAFGLASAIQLLDPELIVLAGGLAQSNPLLTESLQQHLATSLTVYGQRELRVCSSDFGFHAGVIGAAAVAMDRD